MTTKVEIEKVAHSIARKHIQKDMDMNRLIVDFVKESNLTAEHAKRLVERCNTNAFKLKFAKTAQQDFEMADPEKVLAELSMETVLSPEEVLSRYYYDPEIEKAASVSPEIELTHRQQLNIVEHAIVHLKHKRDAFSGEGRDLIKEAATQSPDTPFEKIAEILLADTPSEEFRDIAIKFKISHSQETAAEKGIDALTKVAFDYRALGPVSGPAAKGVEKSVKKFLLSPKARKRWTKAIKGTATAVSGVGAGVGTFIGKNILTSNIYRSNALFEGTKAITSPFKNIKTHVGRLGGPRSIRKHAGTAGKAVAQFLPGWRSTLLFAGGLEGIHLAAKAIGKGIGQVQKQTAFRKMLEEHPDLNKTDLGKTKKYFNSLYRHAPDVAIDPLVAGQLVKNFHRFDGVDYQTVKDLRQTQAASSGTPSSFTDRLYQGVASGSKILGTGASPMNPVVDMLGTEKKAGITGIGTSKLETISGRTPEEVRRILQREAENEVRGKTVGGTAGLGGGAYAGYKILRKARLGRLPLAAGLAAFAFGGATLGGKLGGKTGKELSTLGHKTTRKVGWDPREDEIARATQKNIAKKPDGTYAHRLKRTVFLGI